MATSGGTIHFVAIRDDKKQTVHDIVKRVAKANPGGQKFYTYVPIRPGSLAGKVQGAFVYVPHDQQLSAAPKRHLDAHKVEHAAREAVEGLAGSVAAQSHEVHRVKRSGNAGGPAPYLLAVGVEIKPGQEHAFHAAAKNLEDANAKAKHPVEYSVYKGKKPNRYLFVLRGHDVSGIDPDGHHHTSAQVKAVAATLSGHITIPLRLLPAASSS